MHINPALRALQSSPALQRNSHSKVAAAQAAWAKDPACRAVDEGLRAYAAGEAFSDCGGLTALFEQEGNADQYLSALFGRFLPLLAADPLAQMPFRHDHSDGDTILVLAREGDALLSLFLTDEKPKKGISPVQSVRFTDGERRELVVAGAGEMRVVEYNGAESSNQLNGAISLAVTSHSVRPGFQLDLDCSRQATILDDVSGRLMRLRLTRPNLDPAPAREYSLASGDLIHLSAGSPRDSRHEMMLALLGRMGRKDAAPIMAEMTREGSENLRWQALRECLALDTAAGFAALQDLSAIGRGPLQEQAASLRDQLLSQYPVLAQLDRSRDPCPA